MNKYKNLNTTFDEILTHEIGHIISAKHYGIPVVDIVINEHSRITRTVPSPIIQQALQTIQSNFTLQHLNLHRQIVYEQLIRTVSGDVMLEMSNNRFEWNNKSTKRCMKYDESKNAYEYEKLGFIKLSDLHRDCSVIILSKIDMFWKLKWILWNASHQQELNVGAGHLQEEYNKLPRQLSRLFRFRIKSTLFFRHIAHQLLPFA